MAQTPATACGIEWFSRVVAGAPDARFRPLGKNGGIPSLSKISFCHNSRNDAVLSRCGMGRCLKWMEFSFFLSCGNDPRHNQASIDRWMSCGSAESTSARAIARVACPQLFLLWPTCRWHKAERLLNTRDPKAYRRKAYRRKVRLPRSSADDTPRQEAWAPSPASRSFRYISGMSRS